MRSLWIVGKFALLTTAIMEVLNYVLADYKTYMPGLDPLLPIIAFVFTIFINESVNSRGGVVVKKRISKKVKVILVVMIAIFLSKRLRERLYGIIAEVRESIFKAK